MPFQARTRRPYHGIDSPSMDACSARFLRGAAVDKAEQALINACGRGGKPFFRPPFGDYNSSVLTDLGNAGLTHNVMWSIDVLGWNGLTRDQVINRTLSDHGNGYIYLMHVGSQSQEGPALPTIIDGLKSRGYGFVTIPQMIGGTSTPPPPPPAGGFKVGDTVKVTARLYLRTAPSLTGAVITTMPTGTICTVVGGPSSSGGYTWYQVKTTYGTGWASGQYLQLTTTTTPAPTPTPTGYAPGTKLRVTAGLWLRTAGNLSGSVITTMPTGTICTVVSGPSPSGGGTPGISSTRRMAGGGRPASIWRGCDDHRSRGRQSTRRPTTNETDDNGPGSTLGPFRCAQYLAVSRRVSRVHALHVQRSTGWW